MQKLFIHDACLNPPLLRCRRSTCLKCACIWIIAVITAHMMIRRSSGFLWSRKAKLYVQELIKDGKLELASSYVLIYENSKNRFEAKRTAITRFLEDNVSIYIDNSYSTQVEAIATSIQQTGVKAFDALHTACAIIAQCDYFLTTDDRLLKYHTDRIQIVDPTEFIRRCGGEYDE